MDHLLLPAKSTSHQEPASFSLEDLSTQKETSSLQSDYSASEGRSQTPPTMLEVLGEHLCSKVQWLQEGSDVELDVAKITGILLELGEKQVVQLLQDETLLKGRLQQIIQHVPGVFTRPSEKYHSVASSNEEEEPELDSEDKEQLHDQVWQLEPELSSQLTGMLLELGSLKLKSLLQSPRLLTQAVNQAKAAYCQHNQISGLSSDKQSPANAATHSSTNCNIGTPTKPTARINNNHHQSKSTGVTSIQINSSGILRGQRLRKSDEDGSGQSFLQDSDGAEKEEEEVGELVYAKALRLYPESAAKVTGMLLEMGESRVRELLRNEAQLHKALHLAFTSLISSNNLQLLGKKQPSSS